MSDATVDRLLAERERYQDRAKAIRESAEATDRKLTDDELGIIKDCSEEIKNLDRQLEVVTHDLAMPDEIRDRIGKASNLSRSAAQAAPYEHVGQVIWDALHADRDDDAKHRYASALQRAASSDTRTIPMLDRAAQHMGTDAAATVATAGDLGGLTVRPNVGPIINPYPGRMPLASALGLQTIAAGEFGRPYIVDSTFPDGVDVQTKQKAELASVAFTADTDTVKPVTLGGYLNISAQLLRWQAGALNIIVNQMNRRRSAQIEKALVGGMTASTGKVALAADADATAIQAAIAAAVAAVGKATDEGPAVIAMGWDGYARLDSLVDAAGRPLFPYLSPANALGTSNLAMPGLSSVKGLRAVITPEITDATFWILNGMGVEGHVYYYGVMEAVEPSVLGRQVAVAADFAALRPTPTANSAIHLAP